jgi:uncharacterized protein (DUF2126 family)/transglutaminase-like putative cysteine protease
MRIQIKNWTEYVYERPVTFSPHRIRLYPRTDPAVVTHKLETALNIPHDIQYRRDLFDNLTANCFFPEPSDRLEVSIKLEVEVWPRNPFHFLLASHAVNAPFEYEAAERAVLAPFLTIAAEEEADTAQIWELTKQHPTVAALGDLLEVLHREIEYETRDTGEALLPAKVLERRVGACRDTALFCATILRKAGIATRLVSGFLCEFQVDLRDRSGESGLHAWVEVYLPGAGWVGLDPTNGTFCDHRFIATAVGPRVRDVAPIAGSYFGKERVPSRFNARLDLALITEADLTKIAAQVEETLLRENVVLTMGGEPTFIPECPNKPEWEFAAVGPEKLRFAYAFADRITNDIWPGALTLYTPGKMYPGEMDPRWALNVLRGPFATQNMKKARPIPRGKRLEQIRENLVEQLRCNNHWVRAFDPSNAKRSIWVLPLDHDGKEWISEKWPIDHLTLIPADGPAGLRLPLNLLPKNSTKRALVFESQPQALSIFLPPLLAAAMCELINLLSELVAEKNLVQWQGYVPVDLPSDWSRLAFAADPGVLEVNVPACRSWAEYQAWLERLEQISHSLGLRMIRTGVTESGTGGGQHLLFGGPTLESNPFFTNPAWLASILRFWQHHPALSYVFTGPYVGTGSQAPRADESVPEQLNLELAYQQLEALPAGDKRLEIHEILRHLHVDICGNTHRAEVSFDKFWTAPNGLLGLIEFRAIETFPKVEWASAVVLLFRALLAYLKKRPFRLPLKSWGSELQDRFFLPAALWLDLAGVLTELVQWGFGFQTHIFREIWNWRFPVLLETDGLTVRRALEPWPALAETPIEGGATSRLVDTSLRRLEFCGSAEFRQRYRLFVNGRELAFHALDRREHVVALRYRHSQYYPSLHPQLPVQTPLTLTLFEQASGAPAARYVFPENAAQFHLIEREEFTAGPPCEMLFPGAFTADLRL